MGEDKAEDRGQFVYDPRKYVDDADTGPLATLGPKTHGGSMPQVWPFSDSVILKCSPHPHVLSTWSLNNTILESSGKSGSWAFAEGSGSVVTGSSFICFSFTSPAPGHDGHSCLLSHVPATTMFYSQDPAQVICSSQQPNGTFCCCWDKVSPWNPGHPGNCSVDQAGLELRDWQVLCCCCCCSSSHHHQA